ncbi:uncharacterized protein TEOVI_000036500 [Trypanosoma equiperdum]|uniref:Uncharacterized protein n=1 Tax=Trypanosoma equiperdum TaxID=5694 RepID=A0A1G4I500_TRYEQ|nr:hypothetical protein, conserved [Trypanosoma equiperdum]
MPSGFFQALRYSTNVGEEPYQKQQKQPQNNKGASMACPRIREKQLTSVVTEGGCGSEITAQLQLQLFRIYANVSRQREWFVFHEANARALAAEAEKLRRRFFPLEPSFLEGLGINAFGYTTQQLPLLGGTGAMHEEITPCATTAQFPVRQKENEERGGEQKWAGEYRKQDAGANSSSHKPLNMVAANHDTNAFALTSGWSGGEGDMFDSWKSGEPLCHLAPDYLLRLTASWIHERFSPVPTNPHVCEKSSHASAAGTVVESLVSLLLPILRSLHNLVGAARWRTNSTGNHRAADSSAVVDVLPALAKHLFYLLHEVISCMSLRAVPPNALNDEERAEGEHILFYLLQEWDLLLLLLCSDERFPLGDNGLFPPQHTGHGPVAASVSAAVPQSIVIEAFSLLSTHYLQITERR